MRHWDIQKVVNECHELHGRRHEDGIDTLEIISGSRTVSIHIPWETSPVGWTCERDDNNMLVFRNLRTSVTLDPADVEKVKTSASGSSYPWTLSFFMRRGYIPCQDDKDCPIPPPCHLCTAPVVCDYDSVTEHLR